VWPLVVVVRRTLAIESAWRDPRASRVGVVVNPDPSRGQLSSMLCGLDSFGDRPDAVLQAQVDVPLIGVETVRALVEAWHAARPPLVRPVFGTNGARSSSAPDCWTSSESPISGKAPSRWCAASRRSPSTWRCTIR
jgi:CTP:molybdopterin cytidylyltransferase MocA